MQWRSTDIIDETCKELRENRAKLRANRWLDKSLQLKSQNTLWEEATKQNAIMSVKIKVPGLRVDREVAKERRDAET